MVERLSFSRRATEAASGNSITDACRYENSAALSEFEEEMDPPAVTRYILVYRFKKKKC